jgi:hypothetical protein
MREIEARLNAVRSPFRAAEVFNIEEIVDPRDTRPLLTDWVSLAYELESTRLGPRRAGHAPSDGPTRAPCGTRWRRAIVPAGGSTGGEGRAGVPEVPEGGAQGPTDPRGTRQIRGTQGSPEKGA